MTDTVTPTQADKDAAKDAYGTTPFELEELFARHRLAAEATQAAEIARLRELVASAYAEGWGDAVLGIVSEGPDAWNGSDARAALSAQPSEQLLPNDVVRLVIAARTMAFGDWYGEGEDYEVARKELDDAAEAFASRVEWPDTPSEQEGGE